VDVLHLHLTTNCIGLFRVLRSLNIHAPHLISLHLDLPGYAPVCWQKIMRFQALERVSVTIRPSKFLPTDATSWFPPALLEARFALAHSEYFFAYKRTDIQSPWVRTGDDMPLEES